MSRVSTLIQKAKFQNPVGLKWLFQVFPINVKQIFGFAGTSDEKDCLAFGIYQVCIYVEYNRFKTEILWPAAVKNEIKQSQGGNVRGGWAPQLSG